MIVRVHTDGGCFPNPGPGGWGCVLTAIKDGKVLKRVELSGGDKQTTNNRMEMMAAISALEVFTTPAVIVIFTDSQYLCSGITKWLAGWRRHGWKTKDRKDVKNRDLWERLDAACAHHRQVNWKWVKGHAGNTENERADVLATEGRRAIMAEKVS